ncbi:MAG TPA: hypothetical protein EYM25_03000 [Deltaproteobacteria bacterium]|nr:hypothetical protein [Deltaproteobacteria bacterium]
MLNLLADVLPLFRSGQDLLGLLLLFHSLGLFNKCLGFFHHGNLLLLLRHLLLRHRRGLHDSRDRRLLGR